MAKTLYLYINLVELKSLKNAKDFEIVTWKSLWLITFWVSFVYRIHLARTGSIIKNAICTSNS